MAKFFEYKGRPLVRNGNTLYYGNMFDPYVVMLQVVSTREKDDLVLADKVTVQMMSTDPTVDPMKMVVKKSEKNGLYQAIDIASIWLDRALGEENHAE